MPLTPDEAMKKNKGKNHPQLDRAIQALLIEVESALDDYVGEHVYVGLPAYLQYRVEADKAREAGKFTLDIVDRKLHERFGPSGWKIAIVTNPSGSYCWAKLIDAREV